MSFVYDALPGRVVFGAGASRSQLAPELERLRVSRVLLIAAEREAALATEVCAPVSGMIVGRFEDVHPHVPIAVAQRARQLASSLEVDCLLVLGGGSSIGTAKAIALERAVPIVVLPTTYAGSEMTPIWGLTEASRKTTGRSVAVLPTLVIYDPELTLTLPPEISGPSAMNAIAHCVEALYAPGANPVCSALAQDGIHALATSIPTVVSELENLAARTQALYGSYLAGVCLAGAGAALHHKICHVLGGAFDLPHAEMHTVVLPQVVEFIEPAASAQLARAAQALGLSDSSQLAGALFDLAKSIGAPTALDTIGLTQADLPRAADLILESAPPAAPRQIDRASLEVLLERALVGGRPVPAGLD